MLEIPAGVMAIEHSGLGDPTQAALPLSRRRSSVVRSNILGAPEVRLRRAQEAGFFAAPSMLYASSLDD